MNKKRLGFLIFLVLLIVICITCFLIGIIKREIQKDNLVKQEKKTSYIAKANLIKSNLEMSWFKDNPNYAIQFIFSKNSKDFIVLMDMPKKEYKNYVKYKANLDVEKTWESLLSALQTITTDGHNEFLDAGFFINYYFKIKNPNNNAEYIAIVKNGEIEKNFMKE